MQKLSLIISIAAIFTAGIVLFSHLSRPSIAFIRLGAVVQEFDAMKEAQSEARTSMNEVQSNIESLKQRVREAESALDSARITQSSDTLQLQKLLNLKFDELKRYANSADERFAEQDQMVTGAIMKQINSASEKYAQQCGLDILLGTSTDGNIMFGGEKHDVTDDFIVYLNSSYNKGKSR